MKSWILSLCIVLAMTASSVAFVPPSGTGSKSALKMALVTPPPAIQNVAQIPQVAAFQSASPLNQGINEYVGSSTQLLSLQDRKPPPTKEEIAQKKANFNFWFWGGGFVAPFLATFYYFGFRFWER